MNLIGIILASMVAGTSVTLPVSLASPCAFTVAGTAELPEVIGPESLVARTRVVLQPDSPIRIQHVDVSKVSLNIRATNAVHSGEVVVRVQNVGDRVVNEAMVSVFYWSGRGGSGQMPSLASPLAPGETRQLQARGSGITSRLPDEPDSAFEIRIFVESVTFDDCLYKPSQVFPIIKARSVVGESITLPIHAVPDWR